MRSRYVSSGVGWGGGRSMVRLMAVPYRRHPPPYDATAASPLRAWLAEVRFHSLRLAATAAWHLYCTLLLYRC